MLRIITFALVIRAIQLRHSQDYVLRVKTLLLRFSIRNQSTYLNFSRITEAMFFLRNCCTMYRYSIRTKQRRFILLKVLLIFPTFQLDLTTAVQSTAIHVFQYELLQYLLKDRL